VSGGGYWLIKAYHGVDNRDKQEQGSEF